MAVQDNCKTRVRNSTKPSNITLERWNEWANKCYNLIGKDTPNPSYSITLLHKLQYNNHSILMNWNTKCDPLSENQPFSQKIQFAKERIENILDKIHMPYFTTHWNKAQVNKPMYQQTCLFTEITKIFGVHITNISDTYLWCSRNS